MKCIIIIIVMNGAATEAALLYFYQQPFSLDKQLYHKTIQIIVFHFKRFVSSNNARLPDFFIY